MAKRGVGAFLIVVVVLSCWVSTALAQGDTLEVCYRPPQLPPNVNEWIWRFDEKTPSWSFVDQAAFRAAAKRHQAYRWNPDLGRESLARLPKSVRAESCTPRPARKPAANAPPAPPSPPTAQPPPKKEAAEGSGRESGAGDGKGAAEKDASAPAKPPPKPEEPQPESYQHFHERTHKYPGVLPHRDELPPSASNLPNANDAPILPDAKECALPTAAQPVGGAAVPVMTAYQAECKKKTGDGKGVIADRTAVEKAIEEFVLFAGALTLQLDEDLRRPDGKKFGVVGGRNADGLDNPATQVIAAVIQLAPAAASQVEQFMKKAEQAMAKKAPLVVNSVNELGEEAAEALAKEYGPAIAKALQEKAAIGPYKIWKKFTANLGGQWQAHHLLEQKWFKPGPGRLLKGDPDLVPSVILTDAEHKAISKKLSAEARRDSPDTLEGLWRLYQDAYKDYPAWLDAIKSYFGK
jgi:hypothetical protein